MNLAMCSLASGSSGNCYVVRTETTALLVDAGISGKQISQGLWKLGLELSDLSAVLVTHEHTDHTKGLKMAMKAENAKLHINSATLGALEFQPEEARTELFITGDSFAVGDINISTFALSHDAADPCGFAFESGGKRICIATDTGIVTPGCFRHMTASDLLVLESNHDVSMLRIGRYPWFLKQRILGDHGHLSNEAAADALLQVLRFDEQSGKGPRKRTVLLAHLSQENNFPEMALATMSNILEAGGYTVGNGVSVSALSRTEPSPLYVL